MALIEINLEKPALVEEYQYPAETAAESGPTGQQSEAESDSSGGTAKLLGLLGLLVGVGLLVWKLRSRGGTDEESEPEPEIGGESGGSKGKVAGLLGFVVAAVSLVVAVQKRRN